MQLSLQSYFSPAKLNLFFRIMNKRSDGYHEIASLYQAIDFGDTLTVELAEVDRLTCDDPRIPCDERNLARKALNLFRHKTGLDTFHVRCNIEKKVPIEAGLGGGSSNAATMLYACNQLAGHPASLAQLALWAGEIGSDPAFFFSSGSAYCTGRGEVFSDQPIRTENIFHPKETWIAKPTFGLSTPQVYKAARPEFFEQRDPLAVLHSFIQESPIFFNDLEEPAFRLCPDLRAVKTALQDAGFTSVVMTGSGSAFICIGLSSPPQIPGLSFTQVGPHQRDPLGWYPFPKRLSID